MNHFGSIVNTILVHHNDLMTIPNDAQMKIRMSAELRDRIAAEAERNNRSMNAEIVARLERSLYPASDEESAMAAIRTLMEHGKKYEMDISINMSRPPEKTLALAIKNESLPPDATLEDLKNPGLAIERWEAEKASKGSSDLGDPLPVNAAPITPRRRTRHDRTKT